jgi:serine/threonine protein phosphatase PrpC
MYVCGVVDHKPGRADERTRIEALGGRIGTSEEEAFRGKKKGCCMCLKRCFSPRRPLRVFPGGLSVSRTIGDISLKSTSLIISDPEMYKCQLWPEDECMILACDGVWDVMNNQQVVDVVRRYLEDPEEAARAVAKEAYRRGSTDNISVIVVVFIQPKH